MHKHATDTENAFSETKPGRVIASRQKVLDCSDPLGLVEIHFGNGRVFRSMREDANSAQPVSVLAVCHYVDSLNLEIVAALHCSCGQSRQAFPYFGCALDEPWEGKVMPKGTGLAPR